MIEYLKQGLKISLKHCAFIFKIVIVNFSFIKILNIYILTFISSKISTMTQK